MIRFARALVSALFFAVLPSVAFGQASILPPAETCFQATTGVNGMVGTLGAITGGLGGSDGTYTAVPLTGGSGTAAAANVTVLGGVVTQVVIQAPGANYVVGDVLSASSTVIGGVSGFSVSVASISINSSLAGGTVGFYVPGTLTIKQTYQNAAATILNTNPVQLDANGCALIYGSGIYRQILKDNLGNTVWDQLTSGVTTIWGGTSGGTANAQTIPSVNLTDGQKVSFIAGYTNTGALTVTPSGGSPIAVDKNSSTGPVPLSGGEIAAGNVVTLAYAANQAVFLLESYPNEIGAPVSIAAAATTDLGTVTSHNANVTGTATIGSFGSSASPYTPLYVVSFASSGTILTASTSLITPSGLNVTTTAGDKAILSYNGGGIWQIVSYSTSAVPPTMIAYYPGTTCPAGWAKADGTNGTTDVRGLVPRGIDNGAGRDYAGTRAPGNIELDQLHTFTVTTTLPSPNNASNVPGYFNGNGNSSYTSTSTLSGATFGSETTVKNVALLGCQKL